MQIVKNINHRNYTKIWALIATRECIAEKQEEILEPLQTRYEFRRLKSQIVNDRGLTT